MVGQQWSFEIGADRAMEFETFARDVALPMVRGRMGCSGVLILREGESTRNSVISLWVSRKAMRVAVAGPEWEHLARGLENFGVDLAASRSVLYDGVAFFLAGQTPDAPSGGMRAGTT